VNRFGLACALLGAALLLPSLLPLPAAAQQVRLLVQSSPLAGFNFHEAPRAWQGMRVGDELELSREPGNVYDGKAISVRWRGRMLGYVPRAQNAALAAAMDRGVPVYARVSRLERHRNPRKRIEFEVYVECAHPGALHRGAACSRSALALSAVR